MAGITNQLVVRKDSFKVRRALCFAGAALSAALVGGVAVHASSSGAYAGMDESSISALTALDQAVESVAAKVTPAVVNVTVTARAEEPAISQDQLPEMFRFFGQGMPNMKRARPQLERGIGSGAIISPDGYIVTNEHVVHGATEIRVTLNDRRVLPAKLIGTDKLTDLAVIKVNATNLPIIPWGDSTQLKPGQTVLAFGSPFGFFQFSVTRGIVSGVNRPNPYAEDLRKPGGFIQTDAAINRGNSGGPLVNAHGQVVGINTFLISDTGSFAGAGFAIPTQIVRPTVEALIKNGVVRHGYLGIGINDVTPENAKFFDLKDNNGALVTQVTPESPAGKAGLKQGDVIVQVDNEKIHSATELQMAVSQRSPETAIALQVLRDGKPEKLQVKLGEFQPEKQKDEVETAEKGDGPRLGVAVQDLNSDIREELNLPKSLQGVVVDSVKEGSPAEDIGLSRGDVIQEVNRRPVTSAEEFAKQIRSLTKDKDVLLLVWSRGGASYRVVHPQSQASGM